MSENNTLPVSDDQAILNLSIKELVELKNWNLTRRQNRIRTLLLCYAKHHLDSDEIGYNELNELIFDDLVDTVGDKPYQQWIERIQKEQGK